MTKKVLLAIDIGNTTIAFGAMCGQKVVAITRIDTTVQAKVLFQQVSSVLASFSKSGLEIQVVIICSVVPNCTTILERIIRKTLKLDVKVVGRDLIVPIKNKYKNPNQVGQDRLVGAYAASYYYGKPVIVIDLGTAITFDIVSAKNEYLGGVIVPGLRLSAESLFKKTALLPQIDIQAPKNPIGQTTQESILSGLFYGYGAMCAGMVELLKKQLKNPKGLKVVMTGGHTQLMKRFVSPSVRIIDQDLVFKGMNVLLK
jgi:type III pantothenate kinase